MPTIGLDAPKVWVGPLIMFGTVEDFTRPFPRLGTFVGSYAGMYAACIGTAGPRVRLGFVLSQVEFMVEWRERGLDR